MRINYCTMLDPRAASYRYRVFTPARHLMFKGHCVSIGNPDYNADVMVFSKHYRKEEHDIALRFQGKGVLDICDWHIEEVPDVIRDEDADTHYLVMLKLAETVTVSTPTIKELLNGTGYKAELVQDPYEWPEHPPRFKWPEDGVLQFLWYGMTNNLPGLLEYAEQFDGHKVWILCLKKQTPYGIEVTKWSPDTMQRGFDTCDAVILPQYTNRNYFRAKGANRLLKAVRQGRFVLAHPVPSYQEFSKWMWIGPNLRDGIEWLKSNQDEVEDRIKECQDYIRDRYSPETIGNRWEEVLCR